VGDTHPGAIHDAGCVGGGGLTGFGGFGGRTRTLTYATARCVMNSRRVSTVAAS
jgi:hypothetical protein